MYQEIEEDWLSGLQIAGRKFPFDNSSGKDIFIQSLFCFAGLDLG